MKRIRGKAPAPQLLFLRPEAPVLTHARRGARTIRTYAFLVPSLAWTELSLAPAAMDEGSRRVSMSTSMSMATRKLPVGGKPSEATAKMEPMNDDG